MTETPVWTFRDTYLAEDYNGDEYFDGARPILEGFGWLTRSLDDRDRRIAETVLDGLSGWSLDETDVFSFGLLWALRSTGAVGDVPGLDIQLRDWREWEETDHVGEPLDFLPSLPNPVTTTPAGYEVPDDLDDDPRLWTGEPMDDRPGCTLVWPGDTCYCTNRPGCMWPPEDEDSEVDDE